MTTQIGIIGCGNISSIYLKNLSQASSLKVVAVADAFMDRAKAKAEEYQVQALSVEDMLASDSIDLIVNLTIPKAHAPVGKQVLESGKAVYSEKPFALNRNEGQALLNLAKTKNLYIGCAPDTFLGAGIQTCRKLIDDGLIGEPLNASAFMMSPGHESWHPDPAFYYEVGGGPLFDMGPYYLTALINLMGPVKSVTGAARKSFTERLITSEPKRGQHIQVETPTHITGLLEFVGGAQASLTTSFDVKASDHSNIEIYGSEATLSVPDPNTFGGPVRIKKNRNSDWETLSLSHSYADNSRGLGVADMARAMRENNKARASGELAFHVLEVMQGILEAAENRTWLEIQSHPAKPESLPLGLSEADWFDL